ncbi:single hybrid motif-containing protein [Guyanagaster necrorhizus]|uniref:Single hybrid motif-containing protein n=1 Tax=Guyanagaster necrorhizus TaxID=856835 RepID=A0A9P7W5N7_9AGAR|nr:single hybrid motif-containing protein [Guyanagaster necrorhizus MCA 3950]KAG7453062.1 single hybrid motif-containing protein [Guyanagaster necrorhizus MCA 3950]
MLRLTSTVARRQSIQKNVYKLGIRAFNGSRARPAIMMPAMSPLCNEATITRWMKKEGESFVAGDSLLQIESDVAVVDVVAESPGIIGKILIPAGTRCAYQQVIATVAKNAEELAQLRAQGQAPPPPPATFVSPSAFPRASAPPVYSPAPRRSSTPAAHFERSPSPLTNSVIHRSSADTHHHHTATSRGMSTGHGYQSGRSAPTPIPTSTPSSSQVEGAALRRKIVSSIGKVSTTKSLDRETSSYFDGIL